MPSLLVRLQNIIQQSHRRRPAIRRVNRQSQSAEFLECRALLSISTLSVTGSGTTGDGISSDPQFSRDGRFVAFQSRAEDLPIAASDGNGFQDIFVRNLIDDTTTLISVTATGRAGNDDSWSPTISDNGRFVAFASFATDLGKGTTILAGPNVFVHDRDVDGNGIYDEPGGTAVTLLSHSGTDPLESGNGFSGGITPGAQWENRPVISGNGAYVAYVSAATNLLDPADGVTVTPGPNLYVTSTAGARTELVSIDPTGTTSGILFGGGVANTPSISTDGRIIAFASTFENLVDDDTEGTSDIFVRDILSATTTRVSIGSDGKAGNMASREPVISRNGRHVVFTSRATNLVADDLNATEDTFVHDIFTKTTTLISMARDPGAFGATGDEASPATAGPDGGGYDISDTGRFVLFTSLASNLLDPSDGVADTNATTDVYLFDRDPDEDGFFNSTAATTETTLVSINATGTDAADSIPVTGGSRAVSLSGNGRYAVFVSPGLNLIPGGTSGTGVYLRDLETGTTAFAGLTGLPSALQVGVTEAGITTSPLQITFSSFATDVDPAVADTNALLDVFRYEADTDLELLTARGDGFDRLVIGVGIRNSDAPAPFEIGVYRSADGEFSAAEDELLDTITVSGSDLLMGDRKLVFDIGDGPDEVALPGMGAAETDTDYQILFVLDHLDTIGEFDSDPFNDDNTGRFEGIYHAEGEPGGAPVFIHGRTGVRRHDILDVVEVDATTLDVFFSGASYTYAPDDVSGIRFRGHDGRDTAQTASTNDLLLGGAESDNLRGGAGDDIIGGGPDNDRLFGELGFDTLYDGMGDDLLDLGGTGPDGGIIVSTPGSDDIFIGVGDTLDFSFADNGISIDLDLFDVTQTIDEDLNTIELQNPFETVVGTELDDLFNIVFGDIDREIDGRGGNDTVNVDADGRNIQYDGTTLTGTGGGSITLRNVEDLNIFNAAPKLIDDSSPTGYSDTSSFFPSSPQFPQGFNGGVRFSPSDGGGTATWTFDDITPGNYLVSATWVENGDRASNSPFQIFDGNAATGTLLESVRLNQELPADDFQADGAGWENLGVVQLSNSTLTVQLSDDADEYVVADAIRVTPIEPSLVVMDDRFASVEVPGGTQIEGFGSFGGVQTFNPGQGDTVVNYRPDLTTTGLPFVPGKHEVLATWFGAAGAATNAPFTISNGSGATVSRVNQLLNPVGQTYYGTPYQLLGVIDLQAPDDLTVSLGNDANGMVIADSIIVKPAPVTTVTFADDTTESIVEVSSGDTIDFGIVPENGVPLSGYVRLENTGNGLLNLQDVIVSGPFELKGHVPDRLPPGASVGLLIEATSTSIGTYPGSITITSDDPANPMFGFDFSGVIMADSDAPGGELVTRVNRAEDNQLQLEVLFVADTQSVNDTLNLAFDFADDQSFSILDQTSDSILIAPTFASDGSYVNSVGASVTDGSGNTSVIAPIPLSIKVDPPDVSIAPLANGVQPFADAFFEIVADVNVPHQIAAVEFLVNGVLVDTANQAPFIGNIPQLTGSGHSSITVRALDIFGTEYTSAPLNLAPSGTTISGQKWHDLNGDGIKSPNEPGLNGWMIQVLDSNGDIFASTITGNIDLDGSGIANPSAESGLYEISVPNGDWTVRALAMEGWNLTQPQPDALQERAYQLDRDLDIVRTASTFENWGGRGEKWLYSRNNREWMFVDPNGDVYLWDGSPRNNLTGTLVGRLDAGYHTNIDLLHDAVNPFDQSVMVTDASVMNVNFGSTATGQVNARVWDDLNGDGNRDANEPWKNGQTIVLEDANGRFLMSAVTADHDLNNDQQIDPETEAGWVHFQQLGGGSYLVGQELVPGESQSFPDAQLDQIAVDLNQARNLRLTQNDFRNWGSFDERWLLGDDGWYFVTPDGVVRKWDGSPRTALTGIQVAVLSRHYWENLERISNAVVPGKHPIEINNDNNIWEAQFGTVVVD